MREAYIAKYLRQELAQESMDKAFIELYSNFETDYPSSGCNTYISPLVDDVIKLWDMSEVNFADNIYFLQYDGINTFSQVTGSMESELIYVVVWTIWERECRKYFQYNMGLTELLKNSNIPILYISTDYQRDPEL